MTTRVYIDGNEGECPHDPDFEHEFYYGCVPKDFSTRTGRSRKHKQVLIETYPGGTSGRNAGKATERWHWDGGCDVAGFIDERAELRAERAELRAEIERLTALVATAVQP
jgi:hypothetical protein